jgi:hypothetical protein
MSFDVDLHCKTCQRPFTVDLHTEGGTYAVGGITESSLNITYNYSPHFYAMLGPKGLSELQDRTGADTDAVLTQAVVRLGTERSRDYWEPTPGNAGHALNILLGWARQHPDGVWDVR